MTDGFQDLISRTYTQLKLLGGVTYSEQQVAAAANPDSGLFDADTCQQALRARARRCCRSSSARRHSASRSRSRPSSTASRPSPTAGTSPRSRSSIAFLIGTSKVTLTVDGNVLKRTEVAAALRNTQKHSHAVVAPQKTFDERKVAAFRKFCTDFFDEGNTPKDPLELARHGADKLKGKRDELKATVTGSKYPFVAQLAAPIDLLDQVVGKPDDWYLTDFNLGDDLLDAKESVIDPIQAFLNGAQRVIYDEAADLLTTHSSNLGYLPAGSDDDVRSGAGRPQRLPRQPHGAAQAGRRRAAQPRSTTSSRRTGPTSSRRSRAARPSSSASAYYAKATTGRSGERRSRTSRPDDRARRR